MNDAFTQRLEKIEYTLQKVFSSSCSTIGTQPDSECDPFGLLSAPCAALFANGGKRWRPLLMVLSYELAGGVGEEIYRLAPLIEGIHTASLIHDDIEDASELRRGEPSAHVTYGLDCALNAGSWLYFYALQAIETSPVSAEIKQDLYRTALFHVRALHEGQALDIDWHKHTGFFPSDEAYEQMIRLKTGALAVLAAYTGMRAAGKSDAEAAAFASLLAGAGVSFQIADDVKNITVGNAGKKRGDDIVEGKKSLPVILHIKKHPEDSTLLTAYFDQARKEGIDSPAVEQAVALLNRSGAAAEAAEWGKTVLLRVLEDVRARWGENAAEILKRLFEPMQTS